MKIVFLLPRDGSKPIGGFKVVYEYASHLARRNHIVTIVHAQQVFSETQRPGLRERLDLLRFFPKALNGSWRPDKWFPVDPRVKMLWVPTLSRVFLPRADVYVATWWTTAETLARYESLPGRKLYLIQHLETWLGHEEQVMATWRAPLEKIVITRWLKEIADGLGEPCHHIPNGLDFSRFGCDVPPERRNPQTVTMMCSMGVPWKGTADGLEALRLLKERYPELQAELFGTGHAPENLPGWMTYHQSPRQDELRRIYNRGAIFFAPSHSEGLGLPPCEAMMSGEAVVLTDIGGHREFARHEQNALLVPVQNPGAMAEAASRLIEEPALRLRLARQGVEDIQQYTWKAATDAFELVMNQPPLIHP